MTYIRKTRDEYVLQQYTGSQYGYEDITAEDTRQAARAQLRTYQENAPGQYRIVKHRIKRTPAELEQDRAMAALLKIEHETATGAADSPLVTAAWLKADSMPAGEVYRAAMKQHDRQQDRASRAAWRRAAIAMEDQVYALLEEQAADRGISVACLLEQDRAASVAPAAQSPIGLAMAADRAWQDNPNTDTWNAKLTAQARVDSILEQNIAESSRPRPANHANDAPQPAKP